ncbi:hypothetical protein FB639_006141, partial [Coemansia asiatica]
MAKSARSKSKANNRNILREKVFIPHEQARIQRLAEKQRVKDEQPSEEKPKTTTAAATEVIAADSDSEMADALCVEKSKNGRVVKRSSRKQRSKSTTRTVRIRGKNGQITKKK